jgi:hypothetical protein
MYWEHKPLLEFPRSTDFVADKWVDRMDYLTLCHSQSQKPKIRVKLIIVICWIHGRGHRHFPYISERGA